MSQYPEHDKLSEVSEQTQTVGEFLEWAGGAGITLCEVAADGHFYPVGDFQNLLAEWMGIDRTRLEAEKQQMLAEMRRMNGVDE